jgi:sugar lactone lactonase YvrE
MWSLKDSRLVGVMMLLTVLWAAPSFGCPGDCNGDQQVSVDEVIRGVKIALGDDPTTACEQFDQQPVDQEVTINELLMAVTAALQGCPRPVISTLVGTDLAGYNGDGLEAAVTCLYLPQDITLGPDGLLYIVDWNNHRLRRINGNGVLETVVGNGTIGDAPDGVAIQTSINHPVNIAFDAQGRLLFAAWHNSQVKRVDLTTGLLTNLAGTGLRAFGGDGGPAKQALLDLPSSVVVDTDDNVIFSDQANFRLRMVKPDDTIDTLCGVGTHGYSGDGGPCAQAQLSSPVGQAAAPAGRIAIDAHNNIYIADTSNHAIRRVSYPDRIITTVAGTGTAGYGGDRGPATQAQLNTPTDVAVDTNGVLYIADTENNAVRRVGVDGIITTMVGNRERGFSGDGGPADRASIDRPYGVAVAPNGTLYVADTLNHRIRQVGDVAPDAMPTPTPSPTPVQIPCTDEVGSICTYAGTGALGYNGDGRHRLDTWLYNAIDIEITPSGRRIVIDWNSFRIREILPDDTFRTILGTDFDGDGPPDLSDLTDPGAVPTTVNLNHPMDALELPDGDLLFNNWHNHKLRTLSHITGLVRVVIGGPYGFRGDGGPAKDALVNQPPHSALDAQGNLFFIDQRNERIRVIYDFFRKRQNGIVDTVVGTGVRGFNGDGLALETQLNFPTGPLPEPSGSLTFDGNGALYFADTLNHRIRRVEFFSSDFKQGIVTTIAGIGLAGDSGDGGPSTDAEINFPEDIELGPDGNLYFADTNNHRIRMINLTTGIISAVAGTGTKGYSGDGGPALNAQLDRPFGLGFDLNGDLYIADTFNSRIRKVKR